MSASLVGAAPLLRATTTSPQPVSATTVRDRKSLSSLVPSMITAARLATSVRWTMGSSPVMNGSHPSMPTAATSIAWPGRVDTNSSVSPGPPQATLWAAGGPGTSSLFGRTPDRRATKAAASTEPTTWRPGTSTLGALVRPPEASTWSWMASISSRVAAGEVTRMARLSSWATTPPSRWAGCRWARRSRPAPRG